MDKKSLLAFIAKAHRNTYAAPKETKLKYRCKTPILTGHKDYDFVDGDWRYHDSYAGNWWAPGREVIFFKEKPVWCMSYQGRTADDLPEGFVEEVFCFLKKALLHFDDDAPLRGPSYFKEDDFEYAFELEGDCQYFKGREAIKHKGKEVFFQDVMGELIK